MNIDPLFTINHHRQQHGIVVNAILINKSIMMSSYSYFIVM